MFLIILLISALLIASTSAFFSVFGISHLFANSLPVLIMATTLEIGKLVNISYLYRYWKITPKLLKTYLCIAAVVLMAITSLGTYAYLTSAYAKIAAVPQVSINQMNANDSRITSLTTQIEDNKTQLQSVETSRTRTQATLDAVIGKLTYGNNTTTRNLQRQIDYFNNQATALQAQITRETSERDSLTNIKSSLSSSLTSDEKIGTFLYVAKALGTSLDTIVKWFTVILVLVFDPLSISLLLAYNTAIKNRNVEAVITKWKNGDKVEEQPTEPEPKKHEPRPSQSNIKYYQDPSYDWEKDSRWKSDPEAIRWREMRL